MGNCRFPEHHRSGGGFPLGAGLAAGAVVLVGTSAAFADVMHDVMVMVLAVCVVVTVLGAGGLWVLAGRVARTDYVPVPGKARAAVVPRPVPVPLPADPHDAAQVAIDRGNGYVLSARLRSKQPANVTVKTLGAGTVSE